MCAVASTLGLCDGVTMNKRQVPRFVMGLGLMGGGVYLWSFPLIALFGDHRWPPVSIVTIVVGIGMVLFALGAFLFRGALK